MSDKDLHVSSSSFQFHETHQSARVNITSTTTTASNVDSMMIGNNTCEKCREHVYPLEGLVPIMNVRYHRKCFKCSVCNTHLDLKTYHTNLIDLNDKKIYCIAHKPKNSVPLSTGLYLNGSHFNKSTSDLASSHASSIDSHSSSNGVSRPMELPVRYDAEDIPFVGGEKVIMDSLINQNNSGNKSNNNQTVFTTTGGQGNFGITQKQERENSKFQQLDESTTMNNYEKKNEEKSFKLETSDTMRKEEKSQHLNQIAHTIIKTIDDANNEKDRKNSWTPSSNAHMIGFNTNSGNQTSNNNFSSQTSAASNLSTPTYASSPDTQQPISSTQALVNTLLANNGSVVDQINSQKPKYESYDNLGDAAAISSLVIKEKSESHKEVTQTTVNETGNGKSINISKMNQSQSDKKQLEIESTGQIDLNGLLANNQMNEFNIDLNKLLPNNNSNNKALEGSIVPAIMPRKPESSADQIKLIGDDKGFGRIKLSIFYCDIQKRLSITVHEAKDLIKLDKKGKSDPFARVYLLPDKKKQTKKKTKIVKDNLNPQWEETFDYPVTLAEASSRDLLVNLKDEKGLFDKQQTQFMGEVLVDLRKLNLLKPQTNWYYLQPKSRESEILINADSVLL